MYLARVLSKKAGDGAGFQKGIPSRDHPGHPGHDSDSACPTFPRAAILFFTCLVLMFIGRISLKYMFSLAILGAVGIVFIYFLSTSFPTLFPRGNHMGLPYRPFPFIKSRRTLMQHSRWTSQDRDRPGGHPGKSPGKSNPAQFPATTPIPIFIFAIIIEEYGLVGGSFRPAALPHPFLPCDPYWPAGARGTSVPCSASGIGFQPGFPSFYKHGRCREPVSR